MVVPYTPISQTSFTAVPMGVMAITTSGAPIYNPLSSSNGSLASYYEWTTLDPCYGHTDADYQYHYHAVSIVVAGVKKESCL
jgi:hypothetical protein